MIVGGKRELADQNENESLATVAVPATDSIQMKSVRESVKERQLGQPAIAMYTESRKRRKQVGLRCCFISFFFAPAASPVLLSVC